MATIVHPVSYYYNVHIVSTEVVLPASPTQQHILPLSNLDLTIPPLSVHVFFCYKNSSDRTFESLLSHLKISLSRALVRYYVFAGRLTTNTGGLPELVCNNKGARVTHAYAATVLAELNLYDPDETARGKLVPLLLKASDENGLPVFAVQVTEFSCGGMVVGCTFHHSIAAAAAAAAAAGSISSLKPSCKTPSNPSQSLLHIISLVNVRKNQLGIGGYGVAIAHIGRKNLCVKPASAAHPANPISHYFENNEENDVIREECGVVGIYGDAEAARLCYLALHALQHRGQEGAGIVTATDGVLQSITGVGLVSDVFDESKLNQLPGSLAIGHVRYSTAGSSMLKNVQPFVAGYRFGSVGVAHNGNLVNYQTLRARLEENGSIFNTSSDTEVVLHLIAISKARPFMQRIVNACEQLEGAYSMVFLTEDKLVAVRDPHGFRPLVMGRRNNGAVVFASETCALDLIEAKYEREVNPGEVVVVDAEGTSSLCLLPHQEHRACIFEHIYFSQPNSLIFGRSVYQSRYTFGQILADEAPVDCDVVIAVPDSGVVAALGYSARANVPFQQGLIRSHYVGRTFIEPSQKIRDFGVKLKLAPVRAVLDGKRVVVVDDSIVRGTTSSKIVRLIKGAGAKEVHLRIASPPIIGSCYYGVDTPIPEELISNRLGVEETREFVGADSLAFLPLERLRELLGEEAPSFCDACFSGHYPVPVRDEKVKRVGDFVDDGLNGSVESGWMEAPKI